MSLLTRVASFAALSFCMLGLGSITTASRAAELTSVSLPATLVRADLPIMMFQAPALPAPIAAPTVRFASLEDAVAAEADGEQAASAMADRAEDVACLAGAIYFEAKGEPLSGQLAVANVILSRAKSGRFPSDVCGVVTQRGQFSFVRDGRVPSINGAVRSYRTAVALARVALAEVWDNPAPKALFFHARRVGMGRGTQVASIGNHIFYR
ncbi:MAG: cell wall hydrolase [Janthinobacterium lividum]